MVRSGDSHPAEQGRGAETDCANAEPHTVEDRPASVDETQLTPFSQELTAAEQPSAGRDLPQLPKTLGRYRVEKLLGRGGMGSVWLATDSQLQRSVALKIPVIAKNCPKDLLTRFYREAQSAATLNHPNICPVYDVGQQDGIHYICMAFVEGRPLTDFLKGKPLKERAVAALVRKLALALQEAHERGIVHRDLKPANIMINQRSEPIVMDFGLARQLNEDPDLRMTREGVAIGSPGYMSPEQVAGRSDVGPATDIYSLGVVLYELLAGRIPFSGSMLSVLHQITTATPPPLQQFRADVSPWLASICAKAMAKQPSERYGSMKEFAEALARFLKDDGTQSNAGAAGTSAEEVPTMALAPASSSSVKRAPVAETRTTTVTAKRQLNRLEVGETGFGKRTSHRWWIAGIAGAVALIIAGDWLSSPSQTPVTAPPPLPPTVMVAASAVPDRVTEALIPQPSATSEIVSPAGPDVSNTSRQSMPADGAASPDDVTGGNSKRETPDEVPNINAIAMPADPPQPDDSGKAVTMASPTPVTGTSPAAMPAGTAGPMPEAPSAEMSGVPQPEMPRQQLPGRPGMDVAFPGGFTPYQEFADYDRDHDGKLTPQEFPLHIIMRADKNRDQILSREEFEAAEKKLEGKFFDPPGPQFLGPRMRRGPAMRGLPPNPL